MEDKKRREIKEERTAASKLFENEDHSFTKEIYLEFPVDVMEFIFVLAIVLLKVFFINLV